jgi:hypothetical protein
MAERLQKTLGNDDARCKGDEPGIVQYMRLYDGEVVKRARETERQRGIMGLEQLAQCPLLVHRCSQEDDGLEHVTADLGLYRQLPMLRPKARSSPSEVIMMV